MIDPFGSGQNKLLVPPVLSNAQVWRHCSSALWQGMHLHRINKNTPQGGICVLCRSNQTEKPKLKLLWLPNQSTEAASLCEKCHLNIQYTKFQYLRVLKLFVSIKIYTSENNIAPEPRPLKRRFLLHLQVSALTGFQLQGFFPSFSTKGPSTLLSLAETPWSRPVEHPPNPNGMPPLRFAASLGCPFETVICSTLTLWLTRPQSCKRAVLWHLAIDKCRICSLLTLWGCKFAPLRDLSPY